MPIYPRDESEKQTQAKALCLAGMILIIIKQDGDHGEKNLFSVILVFKS